MISSCLLLHPVLQYFYKEYCLEYCLYFKGWLYYCCCFISSISSLLLLFYIFYLVIIAVVLYLLSRHYCCCFISSISSLLLLFYIFYLIIIAVVLYLLSRHYLFTHFELMISMWACSLYNFTYMWHVCYLVLHICDMFVV